MHRAVVVFVALAACGSPPHTDVPVDGAAPDAALIPDGAIDAAVHSDGSTVDAAPFNDPFAALQAMPGICTSSSWCWKFPTPAGNDYDHVFATGPDNIWLTARGVILQWDGYAWTVHHPPVPTGEQESQFPMAISGSSGHDVWLIYGHQLVHWDGAAWSVADTLPGNGNPNFNNVWVAPDNGDAWVTQSNGVIKRWRNGTATQFQPCGCFLGSVWGTSSRDVFVTTIGGNFHYNGFQFQQIYSGPITYGGYLGVLNDVWLCSGGGPVAHWDGTTLTPVTTPPQIATQWIQPIAFNAYNDVWWFVLFANGGFLHWDGTAMTFTQVDSSNDGALGNFNSGAIVDGHWWMVGREGAVYTTTTPPTLTPVIQPMWSGLHAMWGTADTSMYFAVDGELRYWDGTTLTTIPFDPGNDLLFVTNVTGLHTGGVDQLYVSAIELAPDHDEIACVFTFDGTTWTRTQLDKAPANKVHGIGGIDVLGPGEALAVGGGGVAYHFTQGAWLPVTTNTHDDLAGIWGPDADHAWVVGDERTVLAWTRAGGDTLVPDPVPDAVGPGGQIPIGPISGVAGAPWIASAETGTVWRRDPTGWTEVPAITTGSPQGGLLGISPTDVLIAPSGNTGLFRFDGASWNYEDPGTTLATPKVFATPTGPNFAGGEDGILAHP